MGRFLRFSFSIELWNIIIWEARLMIFLVIEDDESDLWTVSSTPFYIHLSSMIFLLLDFLAEIGDLLSELSFLLCSHLNVWFFFHQEAYDSQLSEHPFPVLWYMLCCVWPLYSGMLSSRDCGMLRHKPCHIKKPVDVESYWMCIEWLCKCAYVYMYRCISFWKNLLEFTHSKLRSSRYSDDLLLFVFVCRTVSPGSSINYSIFIMSVKLGIKWTSRIF